MRSEKTMMICTGQKLRIGTLVSGPDAVNIVPQILPHGFESFSFTFWQTTGGVDLTELAKNMNYSGNTNTKTRR